MEIIYNNFRVTPNTIAFGRYDVFEKIESKKHKGKFSEYPVAHGVYFDRVAEIITHGELLKKEGEVTIKQFVQIYMDRIGKVKEEIIKQLKQK